MLLVVVLRGGHRRVTGGREYVTAAAQRERVTLADGSELALAPGSRVRLAADYGRLRRDVYLEGEAYFRVAHDAQHPFAVHARNAVAQDVGTRFDVRAYAETPAVQIAVTEGAVDIGIVGASREQPARAGDLALVADTAVSITHGIDVRAYVAWTEGDLRFRDTPLPEVAAMLGRWYDLDVDASDPALSGRLITLSVGRTPLDEVLSGVAAAAHAGVTRRGHHVTFTANPHDE
jgi:ferric-dicitrate binding protein FerR (iron transport regulator)